MARINSTQPYSDIQVEQLIQLLERHEADGNARPYDILLNDLPLIPKTTNLDNIRSYEGFLNDKTKSLIFRIFYSNTDNRNYDRYTFTFEANKPVGLNGFGGLNGIDSVDGLSGLIAKEVEKSKKEWDYEKLKKDYDELNGLYEEQEEEITELKQKLAEHESNSVTKNALSNLGTILESIGPDIVRKLTGMPMPSDPMNLGTLPSDNSVTVTPEEKSFIEFMNRSFTETEKEQLAGFIVNCGNDKSMLDLIR